MQPKMALDGVAKNMHLAKITNARMREDCNRVVKHMNQFFEVVEALFVLMEEMSFDNVSSVQPVFDVHLQKINNRYKMLGYIDLYSHTVNCVFKSLEVSCEQPAIIKDLLIITCIMHDFGKCPQISKKWASDQKEKHNITSANMAKPFLKNFANIMTDEHIDLIITAIRSHHLPSNFLKKPSLLTTLLIESDSKARLEEIVGLLKREQK